MRSALAVALVMVLPVWAAGAPGMPDYPAHLATYWLIAGGHSQFYHIVWAWIPNLSGEVLVPLFAQLMSIDAAAKLFVSLGIALWVLGPALIQRALFGRSGAAALFAAFFAYNANLTWGFLNYYFAMGAAFVVFAAWIASDKRPLHVAGFAVAATAVYFSHLFALAVLFLLVASYELKSRRVAAVAASFAPAALAFLFLKPGGAGGGGIAFNFADTALDKIGAAIQLTYDDPSYVLLALLALFFAAGIKLGWIVLHPRMRWPLLAVALAALLAPEWAMGGWAVHMRLPAVLGALAFASVEIRVAPERALAFAAVAVLAFNAFALALDWRETDRRYSAFREAARAWPKNLHVLTVLDGDAVGYRDDQPYWHMAELAIPDAGAFTALLFTTPGQHVVRIAADADRAIAAGSAQQGSPPDIDELDDLSKGQIDEDEDIRNVFPYLMRFQCRYDLAVVVHLDGPRTQAPAMLKLRSRGRGFDLYDVVRDDECAR